MNSTKLLQALQDANSTEDLKDLIAILIKELNDTQEKLKKLADAASKKGIWTNN